MVASTDKLRLPTRQELGNEAMRYLDIAAQCSLPGDGVTRLPFTPEHRQVNQHIREWMKSAGLSITQDDAGTLIGRRHSPSNAKTLLLGSHQDSVINGGRYDGILGIVIPIIAMKYLQEIELPYSVEILAFADEEGVRFPVALLGSRALAGTFLPEDFDLTDSNNISLKTALDKFGGNASLVPTLSRQADDTLGFVEVHIEQGPVLEQKNLPLGVVSSICGIERWQVKLTGSAAHAGTTPMDLRQDALAAAAELITLLESHCRDREGVVGVVGQIQNHPNAVNVIPSSVHFTVELRASADGIRDESSKQIENDLLKLCKRRNIHAEINKHYTQSSVQCDQTLRDSLATALSNTGHDPFTLMSGATHDASPMSDLCPVAMLFVRCKNGLSHHPDESVQPVDVGAAIEAVSELLLLLKTQGQV